MAQIIDLGKIRFNWAGTWSTGIEYSYNDLVKYGPNLYAFTALVAATGVLPTNAATWIVVTEGINYRGLYASGALYYKNDVVIDGVNTYIVLVQHTAADNVALGDANLEIIALGQTGLPSQAGNVNRVLKTDGTEAQWTASVSLNKSYFGTTQGQSALDFETSATLTDVASVFSKSTTDFAQLALVNPSNGVNASADFIAYTADGTNDSGWIDMGITSNDFDAETFGITGAHDGYIFMSAPRTTRFDVVSTAVAGGSATITTGLAHGYGAGHQVRIEGAGTGFDGIKTITVAPTPTTFRFTTLLAPQTTIELDPFGTVYQPTGDGNLVLATDETGLRNSIVFAAGGFSTGRTQMEIIQDTSVSIEINTQSTSPTTGALVVAGGVGLTGNQNVGGNLSVVGQVDFSGVETLPIGPGAKDFSLVLTNPTVVAVTDHDGYAQIAHQNQNNGVTASTDIIMYPDNGEDANGYIDMGITSSTFADPLFTITGPNDGYIFMTAPEGSTGAGNLVLATGDTGTQNKIVFAAGGLASQNEQMAITPDVNVHIEIPTISTSPTTGALTVVGGVGIQGDMNVQGNVSIEGTITFGGAGTTVETANLAVTDPLIFTGVGNQSDIIDLGLITENTVPVSAITATITNKVCLSNVATLTTLSAHTYRPGDIVVVTGVDATFNGTYQITVAAGTNFSYEKIAANVPTAVATGSASVSERRIYNGMVRDASDGVLKFFTGAVTKPTSTVNFAEAGLAYEEVQVGNTTVTGTLAVSSTLEVTGVATVGVPTAIGHATRKDYVDEADTSLIKQTAIVDGDYTYNESNLLTKYKVSAAKTVQNITYTGDGFVSGFTEVIIVGGNTTTTAFTVTTDTNGNITAITQV